MQKHDQGRFSIVITSISIRSPKDHDATLTMTLEAPLLSSQTQNRGWRVTGHKAAVAPQLGD